MSVVLHAAGRLKLMTGSYLFNYERREPLSVYQFAGAGYAIILAALAAILWLLAFKLAELWLEFRDVVWLLDPDFLLIGVALFSTVGCLLLYGSIRVLKWMEEDVKRGLV